MADAIKDKPEDQWEKALKPIIGAKGAGGDLLTHINTFTGAWESTKTSLGSYGGKPGLAGFIKHHLSDEMDPTGGAQLKDRAV